MKQLERMVEPPLITRNSTKGKISYPSGSCLCAYSPIRLIRHVKINGKQTKTASALTQFQAFVREQFIIYVQRITPDQQNLANKITDNLTSWLRDFYLLVVKNHKLACSYLACSLVTLHGIKYEVNNAISNVQK